MGEHDFRVLWLSTVKRMIAVTVTMSKGSIHDPLMSHRGIFD